MRRSKLSLEEVQRRIDKIGRNYKVIEWNGTNKPCKVVCNDCGHIMIFKSGNGVYSDSPYLNFSGCSNCKRLPELNEYIDYYKEKISECIEMLEEIDNISEEQLKYTYDRLNNFKSKLIAFSKIKELYEGYKSGKVLHYYYDKDSSEVKDIAYNDNFCQIVES